MKDRVLETFLNHPRVVLIVLVTLLLLTGFVGEVVAHNPAGIGVPGCENGAEVVAHKNMNCHGG